MKYIYECFLVRKLLIRNGLIANLQMLLICDSPKHTGVTLNIYSLKKYLPGTNLQRNAYSSVITSQEAITPGSHFYPGLNTNIGYRTMSGKKSSYVRQTLLHNGDSCPALSLKTLL